ncbi:MAG: XylR N-terminal domain-containing protein [Desulfotomaculaceae bacterium]|nr:XylR N-terminal domain-containing protein [Desulfotomaculaceae bacterium]
MLRLQPEAGKNYLNNMRVLILNTHSVGILRKNLIINLGTEQAKRLIISYSFACGYHDAESTMHDFSLKDKNESYQLGTLLHTFIGMVHATPLEIHLNKDKTKCIEGIWYDSYEAENHIKHFGPATEPVCWSLAGYASGIMSALWGELTIIKEVACIAKGDPYCRYIGKTMAHWGDEILPDLHYYQGTNLGETLEQSHDNENISEQNTALKQSIVIHEQINRMVLDGDNLLAIASKVSQIIGGTIFVEDQSFRPVAYFSPTMATGKDLPAQGDCSTRDIFNNWSHNLLASTLIQEKRTIILSAETSKKPFARLISPIVIGQDLLGYVSFFKTSGKFTWLDRVTLERAAAVFALKMRQTRTVAETEARLKVDLVEDLIKGNFDSETSIIEKASCLGYNLNQPHNLLIINVDKFKTLIDLFGGVEKQLLRFKNLLCNTVNLALDACSLHGTVTAKGNNVIVITELDPNATCTSTDLAHAIQERVRQRFLKQKITVSIGIGRTCHTPSDFELSYQEARRALTIIKGLNQTDTVVSYDNLGIYGLLFYNTNQQNLLDFMKKQLGKLLEYDAKYQSQLVETLHLYFRHDGNIKDAADAAAVTPSGFKYRLGKISEVGSFNLKESDKRFDLQMALKIWCILEGDRDRVCFNKNPNI